MRTLFVSLLFLLIASHAFADNKWPVVYTTLPEDPTHNMIISWITPRTDENDTVYYRQDAKKHSWKKNKGWHLLFPTGEHLVHHALLEDLKPGTLYRFAVGDEERVYYFRTIPQTAPLKFVIGGDANQLGLSKFKETTRRAARQNPDFAVLGGDLAYSCKGKNSAEEVSRWLPWLSAYSETMVYHDRLIPLAVVIGNHDVPGFFNMSEGDAQAYYMLFPHKGYHIIRVGSLLSMYLLDSGHTNSISGDQKEWLQKHLIKDAHVHNRFAVYHMPAYPLLAKTSTKQTKSIRKHWVPLFEEHKLHAAFEHHEHAYKRSYPLYKNEINPRGVMYIGGGAWGAKPRSRKGDTPYLATTRSSMHFISVTLNERIRIFETLSPTGEMLDAVVQPYTD